MLLPLLFACGAATDSTADTEATAASGALTLDNCGGTVEDGVPEPWASWVLCTDLSATDTTLTVHSTDLPPHPSPYYETDSANWEAFQNEDGQHHQNPNTIASQAMSLQIPLDPVAKGITITADKVDEMAGDDDDEYRAQWQGVGIDGTALFAGTAAPGDDIEQEEYTFDEWEGHPQDTGVYHHHGANPAALAVLAHVGATDTTVPGEGSVEWYGVMCDGTMVLGCDEFDGSAPDPDTLDAQNGHVGDLAGPDGEVWLAARYHVHACADLGRWLTPEIAYYETDACL